MHPTTPPHLDQSAAQQSPLDRDLAACVVPGPLGPAVRHPLVVSIMYTPAHNDVLNEQLHAKRAAVAMAAAAGDVERVVWLHERPWRAETFATHAHLLDDRSYWQLLRRVWCDSENIMETIELWKLLLRVARAGREAMMHEHERAALAALPDTVRVYQGHTDQRDDGWSWTTDPDVATWFARRFQRLEGGRACVTSAFVSRDRIIAYLLQRGESEVIVAPDDVRDRQTSALA